MPTAYKKASQRPSRGLPGASTHCTSVRNTAQQTFECRPDTPSTAGAPQRRRRPVGVRAQHDAEGRAVLHPRAPHPSVERVAVDGRQVGRRLRGRALRTGRVCAQAGGGAGRAGARVCTDAVLCGRGLQRARAGNSKCARLRGCALRPARTRMHMGARCRCCHLNRARGAWRARRGGGAAAHACCLRRGRGCGCGRRRRVRVRQRPYIPLAHQVAGVQHLRQTRSNSTPASTVGCGACAQPSTPGLPHRKTCKWQEKTT